MRISEYNHKIALYLEEVEKGEIKLPPLQRPLAWSEEMKREYVENIGELQLLSPFIIAKLPNGERHLIDGQQRTIALREFLSGKLRANASPEKVKNALIKIFEAEVRDLNEAVNLYVALNKAKPLTPFELALALLARERPEIASCLRDVYNRLLAELSSMKIDRAKKKIEMFILRAIRASLGRFSLYALNFNDVFSTLRRTPPDLCERLKSADSRRILDREYAFSFVLGKRPEELEEMLKELEGAERKRAFSMLAFLLRKT